MPMRPLTEQQLHAAETTGRDLLVAASAGTGKTTVLSRRVLHLLIDHKTPLKEILAVTFTEAAAADMRRKIGDDLREHLKEHPDNAALSREHLLLDRAPISTIHSFCMKVLREYFHLLNLDPGFEIIDPDEGELLQAETAEQLLEDWFAKKGDDGLRFRALAETYGGSAGNDLEEVIHQLHAFLQTLDDPDGWRQQTLQAFHPSTGELPEVWMTPFVEGWKRELDQCLKPAQEALKIIQDNPNLQGYLDQTNQLIQTLSGWRDMLQKGLRTNEWDGFLADVRAFDFGKLKPVKAGPGKEEAKEKLDQARDRLKKHIQPNMASQGLAQVLEDLRQLGPHVELLLNLQQEFDRQFRAAKDRKALLDFNDLERYCLRLLREKPNVADEIRRKYKHVLVDEYQDVNPLQDAILQALSFRKDGTKANQLFLVGDEKQSIYGFRLAAPDIFQEKYRRFQTDLNAAEVRIPLTHNFRCRRDILHAVNHLFERIVTPDLGSTYDKEVALTYGADYPEAGALPVEVHLLEADLSQKETAEGEENEAINREGPEEPDEDKEADDGVSLADKSKLEREAYLIGTRIQELIDKKSLVKDDKTGTMRPVQYRDMVILLRATKGRADTLAGVLRNLGVPVYADLATGFFDAVEVTDVIALLEVLDNAQQDVPLAAVLRSPLVGLNDDQLAQIRIHTPGSSVRFHHAVDRYRENGPDAKIKDILHKFQVLVDQWRQDVLQLPLAHVVWEIYRETSYLEYVQGLPGGEGRRANLVQLHDRARQFDHFSRRGLFRFLRFLRRLRDANHDQGAAPVLSESDDVVRIMSIHKSKGLEFPIVFLPDLAKRFNERDFHQAFLLHRHLLLGLDRVDLERRSRNPTLPKQVIAQAKRVAMLAEEQRLLYVALTRARERLILTGTAKLEKIKDHWSDLDEATRASRVLSAKCLLDWIGPVLARHPDGAAAIGTTGDVTFADDCRFVVECHSAGEINTWKVNATVAKLAIDNLSNLLALKPVDAAVDATAAKAVDDACRRLQWTYPNPHLRDLRGKVNPSGFKKRFEMLEEEETPAEQPFARLRITREPQFKAKASGKGSASDRGLATHIALQHLDFKGKLDKAGLADQIQELVTRGLLRERESQAIEVDTLASFFARPLGQRLRRADRVEREVSFSLLLPAGELPDADKRELTANEKLEAILIQGTIDCLFWEGTDLILIDYKTDDLSKDKVAERLGEYRSQIWLYRRALQGIHGQEVKECFLAFLKAGVDEAMK